MTACFVLSALLFALDLMVVSVAGAVVFKNISIDDACGGIVLAVAVACCSIAALFTTRIDQVVVLGMLLFAVAYALTLLVFAAPSIWRMVVALHVAVRPLPLKLACSLFEKAMTLGRHKGRHTGEFPSPSVFVPLSATSA